MSSPVRRGLRLTLRLTERFLAVIGLCTLVYHFCLDFTVIVTGSMAPTLQGTDSISGDRVLFEKVSRRFHAPRRWEIHQFLTEEGILAAKRIVGLPGEHISLRNGIIHIDGKPMPFPPHLNYLHYYPYGNLSEGKEVDCGSGYYVLGDDSRDSSDSRFEKILTREQFTSRAWLILGPSGRRGIVQ